MIGLYTATVRAGCSNATPANLMNALTSVCSVVDYVLHRQPRIWIPGY